MEQDYITLVNICRDASYLVIKPIEDQKIEIIMEGSISKEAEYETAVTFVDNTDFGSEGEDYQQKMQIILNTYTRLFQATEGAV